MLPDEMQPPKTKFLPQDRSKEARSTSSSRLKSFPAEKIRKLDNSPMFSPESVGALLVQQDPRETKNFFASSVARSNNGHGDAISAQFSSFYQQPKLKSTSSPSQQQIAANHQQISQANPQSESLLTRRITSPERQAHRPFVPTAFQGSVIRDRSPRNSAIMNQPKIIQSPSTQVAPSQMQQFSNDPRAVVDENRDGTSAFDACEKQPVGGRNAVNHRQMVMQLQEQRQAPDSRDMNAPSNVRSASNCHHMQPHDTFQQNPRRVYQQMQRSVYHPQTLQQPYSQPQSSQQQQTHDAPGALCAHYVNRQLSAARVCGQGMTSPQDMTVSQMKLMRHSLPTHQQSFGYPVNLQAAWPQNDRWMQTTSQSRQVPLQQPSSPSSSQCQCYRQVQAASSANFDQQSFRNQDRSNSPRNRRSTSQQSVVAAQNRQDAGKTIVRFTPDMIRDQELLIATLKQQCVPDDIIHRQFDALLNEQRRHLAYIAQIQAIPQAEDADLEIRRLDQSARGRERDEKPEWMVHITPPRISYYEIEMMRAQQKALKKQCTMGDQPLEEIGSTHVQQQNYRPPKQEQMTNQVVPLKQMHFQTNPYQQQMAAWSRKGAVCCPHGHQQNVPNSLYCQPSLPLNVPHSCNMPHNPYYHSEQQKTWSEQHDPNSLKSMNDQRVFIEPARFCEQRQVEPSSLLKMRVYKEMIRPQRRNDGLQDPETIQKALKALKDPTSRRGLEYLANLTKRKPTVKLNGTQDPGEIPDELRSRLPATSVQIQKRAYANGLENRRNPNNPPPRMLRPKRVDESMMPEYPRQRKNAGTRYSVQAERENGTAATSQQQDHARVVSCMQGAQSIPCGLPNASAAQDPCGSHLTMMSQCGGAPLQHRYQLQRRYYLNEHNSVDRDGGQGDVASTQRLDAPGMTRIGRAGGDTTVENLNAEETTKHMSIAETMRGTNGQPEVRETRTIGGVTYLPRKPDYACDNLIVSPNQLIASGHLQPPRIL
ncbi:hypothetical protein DMN91_005953 [Ooceraea biroi]|uniref:Uncharacterized protein n=2 Tax=Ooceraea biroi TaxID=2015173 RepID=A0A3L8DMB4_OOCBI|nr:hypothetical protein DMN91_005953 [Ooceraea biroi]